MFGDPEPRSHTTDPERPVAALPVLVAGVSKANRSRPPIMTRRRQIFRYCRWEMEAAEGAILRPERLGRPSPYQFTNRIQQVFGLLFSVLNQLIPSRFL